MAGLLALPLAADARAADQGASAPPTLQAPAHARRFDPAHTRFGFELRTRWGQRVQGHFPVYDGAVEVLDDGRHLVRVRLSTADVEVDDSERYTAMARGERFFDAARHPLIEFVSDPYRAELVHDGGQLRGYLAMHGTRRREDFTLLPATCQRPGTGCDVEARGVVDRGDYGLDGWRLALARSVRFTLRVRLQELP